MTDFTPALARELIILATILGNRMAQHEADNDHAALTLLRPAVNSLTQLEPATTLHLLVAYCGYTSARRDELDPLVDLLPNFAPLCRQAYAKTMANVAPEQRAQAAAEAVGQAAAEAGLTLH